MEFPGNNNWQFFDVQRYRQAREAAGAPLPAAAPRSPSGPPAAGADDLAGQLAGLRLGRRERRRAADARAALAPRNALPGIGGSTSMRLPAPAAAALVGREYDFHSARMPYVPESPPDSPEPYAVPQPARRSSAYASHTTRADAAPRRKGGFMSGFTKGLKKVLGFGSKRREGSSSRDARYSSSYHGADASRRPSRVSSGRTSEALHRMDSAPQSPDHVYVPPQGAGHEVDVEPEEFQTQSIPTSPGSRSDYEQLAHSFGREHGAELDFAPWTAPIGMPSAAHWQPLPPSGWESTVARWDADEAERTGAGPWARVNFNLTVGAEVIHHLRTLFPLGPANQRRAIEANGGESTARYWLRDSHGVVDSSADFGHQAVQYGGAVCSDYAGAAAGLLLGARVRDPVAVVDVSLLEANDHRVALAGDPRVIGRENTVVVDAWANNPRPRTLAQTNFNPVVVQQYDPSQNAGVSVAQLHNGGYRIPRVQVDEFLGGLGLPPIGAQLVAEIIEIAPPYDY